MRTSKRFRSSGSLHVSHATRSSVFLCLMVGFLVLVGLPGARADDFSSWAHRMQITFSGYNRNEDLTNFPVLVKLSEGIAGFHYSDFLSGDHDDLRFTASNMTDVLHYDVEEWNTGGTSFVWVELQELTSSDDSIWAYWGKAAQSAPAYTTNGGAWDSHYRGVWHMNQTNAQDSTSYGHDGTASGNTDTTGLAGGAQAFDDTAHINMGTNSTLGPTRYTVSAWVNVPADISGRDYRRIVCRRDADGAEWDHISYELHLITGAPDSGKVQLNHMRTGAMYTQKSVSDLRNKGWKQVVGVYDGTTQEIYVDGLSEASGGAGDADVTGNQPLNIGKMSLVDPQQWYFLGDIDEVRVSDIGRSSNWIWATWMNVKSNSVFNTYGCVWPPVISDADYNWKMQITFSGYDKGETLEDFPALVKLSETGITDFYYNRFLSPPYGDLRFVTACLSEELPFEVEEWNTGGTSFVWVGLCQLTSSNDSIWAYWGRKGQTAPAYTTNGAVWDSHYRGVWHMNQTNAQDSTSYGHHGTSSNNTDTTGLVSGGQAFDGNDYIVVGTNSTLGPSRYTVSAWVNLPASILGETDRRIISRRSTTDWSQDAYELDLATGPPALAQVIHVRPDDVGEAETATSDLRAAGWKQVVGVYDGSTQEIYVDGVRESFGAAGDADLAGTQPLKIGVMALEPIQYYFLGDMDEVRVSDIGRSGNWIWATWMNVKSNAEFNTYGPAQDISPAGTLLLVR